MDRADLADRIRRERDRLQPRLPDIDPGDLLLILENLLRGPVSGRRFFLRPIGDGIYVP